MAEKDSNNKTDKDISESSENYIKLAQVLNENELNNLNDSSNLQALSPEDALEENLGTPSESIQTNNIQVPITNSTEQVINTEDLEGVANEAIPQEGLIDNVAIESLVETEIAPTEETLQGSPSQGLLNNEVLYLSIRIN